MKRSPSVMLHIFSHAAYLQRQGLKAAIGFDEGGAGASMSALGLGGVVVAGHGVQPKLLTKSGGGVGFMSYVALVPGRNVGLFVAVSGRTINLSGGTVRPFTRDCFVATLTFLAMTRLPTAADAAREIRTEDGGHFAGA